MDIMRTRYTLHSDYIKQDRKKKTPTCFISGLLLMIFKAESEDSYKVQKTKFIYVSFSQEKVLMFSKLTAVN